MTSGIPIRETLKKEIIDFYLSKPMGLKEVCEKFNISHPTSVKILKDVEKWSKNILYNPNLVENYFQEINSEAKAYFLGLLIADGNVFDPPKRWKQICFNNITRKR